MKLDKTDLVKVKNEHVESCPRYGLLCECEDCLPPVCLCNLIEACILGSPEDVRMAFFDAVEAL